MSRPNDAYNYAGLDWQASAPWFGTTSDAWQVSIDSAAGQKVAAYWQGLVGQHLLSADQSYSATLYKDMAAGKILSDVNAVWDAPILASSDTGQSGQWAVAPMPVWSASSPAYGNDGGSSTAVLKGCQYPQQAAQFADWMSTNPQSVTNLIDLTGIYPAATSGLTNSALCAPDKFFGDQVIYDVFKAEMPDINTSWQWGPTMTQTSTDLGDVETGSVELDAGGRVLRLTRIVPIPLESRRRGSGENSEHDRTEEVDAVSCAHRRQILPQRGTRLEPR